MNSADNAFRLGSNHGTSYTHAATHRLTKVDEGASAAAPATFDTQDWRPTIGGSGKPSRRRATGTARAVRDP